MEKSNNRTIQNERMVGVIELYDFCMSTGLTLDGENLVEVSYDNETVNQQVRQKIVEAVTQRVRTMQPYELIELLPLVFEGEYEDRGYCDQCGHYNQVCKITIEQ